MIKFEAEGMTTGTLKTVKVNSKDMPGILPPGSRCQIMAVNPRQLSLGDIVATPDGRFRRFWSSDGKSLWVTDHTGLTHECTTIKDGVVRKVIVRPGLLSNLAWMLGASAGRLRRRRR